MKLPNWLPSYGQQLPGKQPSETIEQVTFFARIRDKYPDTYGKTATHIRNEGERDYRQTAKQKAEGLTPGAADIIIPGSPSLVIEMKSRAKTAKISQEQLDYLEAAQEQGAFVCVAFGCDAAMLAFDEWRNAGSTAQYQS